MKFLTTNGINRVHGNQRKIRKCDVSLVKVHKASRIKALTIRDEDELTKEGMHPKEKFEAMEKLIKVKLDETHSKKVV